MFRDKFPFKEFRPNQEDTLNKIEEAFKTKKYVILQGSTGCLSGDTIIHFNRGKKGFKCRIECAYYKNKRQRWQVCPHCNSGSYRAWTKGTKTFVRSYREDHRIIGLNGVVDITQSGIKDVYELVLIDNTRLKGTFDHKILTNKGWIELGNLTSEYLVMKDDPAQKKSPKSPKKYRDTHIGGLWAHPYAKRVKTTKYKLGYNLRVPLHRAMYEMHTNGLTLEGYKLKCRTNTNGLKFVDPNQFDVHHKNGDHYDNGVENLELLSRIEHMKKHGVIEYVKNFRQGEPYYINVKEVRYVGKEMTYDIQCADPHHNFVANGVVVHNCGKSALALAVARSFKDSYIATANKFLQDQYMRDFSDYMTEMKGRANYSCYINPSHNCGNAVCKIEKADCGEKASCQYFLQLAAAKKAQTTLFNFASALAFLNHTKNFPKREFMTLDECHNASNNLANFVEVAFSYKYLKSLKLAEYIPNYPPDEYDKYIPWLGSIREAIRGILAGVSAGDTNIESLESLKFKIETFVERWKVESENWVIDKTLVERWDKNRPKDLSVGDVSKIAFKPVFVNGIASQYLLPHADKFLLMSATVLSPDDLLAEIGINPEEAEFIDVPTTFPKKNRLFVFDPVGWMSYSSMDALMPKIEEKTRSILNNHKNERGIIHVPSYKMAEKLDALLADTGRITFPRNAAAQAICMEEHAKRENSVLLSPSMKEGVDLKDALCYDSETDILTEIGWVKLPELREGLRVATYHKNGKSIGKLNFECPTEIIRTEAKEWVEFDTMTNNLMVTKKHRMLWRKGTNGVMRETTADDIPIKRGCFQFIGGGLYESKGLDFSDDELRLVVAYQADGCWDYTKDDVTYVKFSFKKTRKINRLKELLGRLNYKYTEHSGCRGNTIIFVPKKYFIKSKILGEWGFSKHWELDGLLRLSIQQRKTLIDELPFWDGTIKSFNKEKGVYTSSLLENLDTIQAVLASVGYRSYYNGSRLCWHKTPYAYFVMGEFNYIKKDNILMPAYCVTVSSGWVVVRRRGKVVVSGNSRFTIIEKVPYPSLSDPVVKRKMELSKTWYPWVTMLAIIQSHGRSVRSETDYAVTYMLDGNFKRLYDETKHYLPAYFKEAIVW